LRPLNRGVQLPELKKAKRIAASDKSQAFMEKNGDCDRLSGQTRYSF